MSASRPLYRPQLIIAHSVRSSLSPNGARLAVSDLSAGFEVYDLETDEVVRAVKYEGGDQERAIPVAFIHGGHAIVCGSTVGKVNVWFVDSGTGLDALHIPGTYGAVLFRCGTDNCVIQQGDGKVLALAVSTALSNALVKSYLMLLRA